MARAVVTVIFRAGRRRRDDGTLRFGPRPRLARSVRDMRRRSFGLRRLTPNWLWLKGPEWDKHKFGKPIATLDRPFVASLIAVQRSTKISLIVAL